MIVLSYITSTNTFQRSIKNGIVITEKVLICSNFSYQYEIIYHKNILRHFITEKYLTILHLKFSFPWWSTMKIDFVFIAVSTTCIVIFNFLFSDYMENSVFILTQCFCA